MREHPTKLVLLVVLATGLISCAGGFTLNYLQDLQSRSDAYVDSHDFRAALAAMRYQIKATGANITLRGYSAVTQTECSKYQYEMNMAYSTDTESAIATSSSAQTKRLLPLLDGSFSPFFAQATTLGDKENLMNGAWVCLPAAHHSVE